MEKILRDGTDIDAIRVQAGKVTASGVLGRSRFYAGLLEFLVACAEQGRTPKELEIAAEVFGRGSDFDPSQDSMVRVYAHNLRQKLQQFYTTDGRDEPRQLAIPKGEYRLGLADRASGDAAEGERPRRKLARGLGLGAAAALLLALGLVAGMILQSRLTDDADAAATVHEAVAATPLWSGLFDDELPILIVVGDYFIFGELDAEGNNIERLLREFSINSSRDLDDLLMYQPELAARYVDLDLTYLPRSTAHAMRNVLRILYTSDKPVRSISMSELNVADFKTSHVVYIGYVSGLDKLLDFVFVSSGISVGGTFDELVHTATGKVYTSGAGVPAERRNYRDYGLFSTFPGPSGNQFMVFAGTRDAGLMHTAQAITDPAYLRVAEKEALENGFAEARASELLFEVTGFGRTSLDAMIVHAAPLDYHAIWGGELLQSF